MGICTEQAIKIRNLVKTAGVSPAAGAGGGGGVAAAASAASALPRNTRGGPSYDIRTCEKLRAAREHARLTEQHAEILVLSSR